MALYAFDGTWNSVKEQEDPKYQNTNVVRFYNAYHKHSKTDDYYLAGVGTRLGAAGKVFGGVFGLGELPRLNEAYDHLCNVWASGDHTIDVIGFSRGAATTLDFCHRVQEDGIRRPGTNDVIEANPRIRFLGVWDIVASFGLANLGNQVLNIGHHLSMPKSNLQYCFHAMALDERRPSFLPTRLHGACEVWFRGVHSDVGGGNMNKGLNDITLKWMMSKAKAAGLPITDADIAALQPNPAAEPRLDTKLIVPVRLVSGLDRRHYSVSSLAGCTNPPDSCPVETQADEQNAIELGNEPVQVLSTDAINRVNDLWATAEATANTLNFPIDGAKGPLVTLFQGRVVLITNEAQLAQARSSVGRLIRAMVDGAQKRSFHVMNEFFLTEALSNLHPLFPLTD